MEHLITVAALLAGATFVTGLVLPLTTRHRTGSATDRHPGDGPRDHDEIAAARLAARG